MIKAVYFLIANHNRISVMYGYFMLVEKINNNFKPLSNDAVVKHIADHVTLYVFVQSYAFCLKLSYGHMTI